MMICGEMKKEFRILEEELRKVKDPVSGENSHKNLKNEAKKS